jgi:hypothetical protein
MQVSSRWVRRRRTWPRFMYNSPPASPADKCTALPAEAVNPKEGDIARRWWERKRIATSWVSRRVSPGIYCLAEIVAGFRRLRRRGLSKYAPSWVISVRETYLERARGSATSCQKVGAQAACDSSHKPTVDKSGKVAFQSERAEDEGEEIADLEQVRHAMACWRKARRCLHLIFSNASRGD